MTTMTARQCLDHLLAQTPCRLEDLPSHSGIYGLWDAFGEMRYVGSTQDLRDRVWSRHVTGSEGKSHKLAQELNQHLFYVDRATRLRHPARAKTVRGLRQRFVRGHYKATFVDIMATTGDLKRLERQVIDLAEPGNRLWNDRTSIQTRLSGHLAALITDFVRHEVRNEAQRAALRTQAALWKSTRSHA